MSLIKPVRAMQLNKNHPLARSLSGCWLFNEGCGEQINDVSGNGLNIPVAGGTPEWTSGNHGSAMYFDNNENEYLELDTAPVTNIPCTILAWLCPQDVTQGNYYYPIYIANKNVNNKAWGILLNWGSNGEVSLVTNIWISDRAIATKCVSAGRWHQVVGVVAGLTDRRCYVDGTNKGVNSNIAYVPYALDRISIGHAGDSTPGYNFPGKIGCVFVWNRVLSDDEIAWLYREPYAMFETETRSKSLSFPVSINSLSGSINAKSLISGKLVTNNKMQKLDKSWLLDSLYNGMTSNAFKLNTTLSIGWFWMRSDECNALYRGGNIEQIDFGNILKIVDSNAENISAPAFCEHENDTSYYYIVRCFNKCGVMERTLRAAIEVSLDSNGNVDVSRPNAIFTSSLEISEGDKVRLKWFYCPLEQISTPVCFRVYFDNGSGQIDYGNSISEIEYTNRNDYQFLSQTLEDNSYSFVIRAVNADGIENVSSKEMKVRIENIKPPSIQIISVTNSLSN